MVLLSRIAGRVAETPQKTALAYFHSPGSGSEPERLTYKQVWSRASSVAKWLEAQAPAPHEELACPLIAILVDQGPMLPIIMLGVLMARMAIMPLDPLDPPARISFFLSESRPSLIISQQLVEAQQEDPPPTFLVSDLEAVSRQSQATTTHAPPPEDPDGISHVYFTSGSTGTPKGCVVTLGSLASYAHAKSSSHCAFQEAVVLLASAVTFDPFLGDVVSTWSAGGSVCAVPRQSVLSLLGEAIKESKATHVLTTPTLFSTLNGRFTADDLPSLECVALGGEVMPRRIVDEWGGRVRLINTYGVTECTVYQAYCVMDTERRGCQRLLGEAMGDNLLFVKQEEGGILGELWIGGPQVGRGYLGGGELTRQRFVKDPEGVGEGVWFRTGDYFKKASPDGEWEFAGRKDTQVKVRGRRIDLGEVEDAIKTQASGLVSIKGVACSVTAGMLIAWCVPPEGYCGRKWDAMSRVLRACTAKVLPQGLVPGRFVMVPEEAEGALPETATGKLNRKVISGWVVPVLDVLGEEGEFDGNEDGEKGDDDGGSRQGEDWWERQVGLVWASELGLGSRRMRGTSHFFELGGDSMSALRAARRLSQVILSKVALPAKDGDDTDDDKDDDDDDDDDDGHDDDKGANKGRLAGGVETSAGAEAAAGGQFGERLGTFAPGELMKRPILKTYAAYLRNSFGGDDPGVDDEKAGKAGMSGDESTGQAESQAPAEVWGEELLVSAAGSGAHEVVSFLVGKCGVPAHQGGGGFALHAACKGAHLSCVNALLQAGASPNALDSARRTPLHLAAQCTSGGLPVIQALLAAKAVPSARDGDRQSVMHHAGRGGAPKSSLEALMEALGKDKAVQRDKTGASPIDWLDAWGRTSLHWAVINGHSSVVSWLLSQGAQQSLRDSAGETALEMAERRARCGAKERGDGERASVWANIAALLGGSGTTKNLKAKGYYDTA